MIMENNPAAVTDERVDDNVSALIRFINSFDGLQAISGDARQDRPNDDRTEIGTWEIIFTVNIVNEQRVSTNGWVALEFLVWACQSLEEFRVNIKTISAPPFINGVGSTIRFVMEGINNEAFDLFHALAQYREEYFVRELGFPFNRVRSEGKEAKQRSLFPND